MSRLLPTVCVVLPDPAGATLSLGEALADRLPNVTLGRAPDPCASINYFLDPAMRIRKGPTLEMGWFAHVPEGDLHTRLAGGMDQAVAPTQALADRLNAAGATGAVAIPPGACTARPGRKLRVGVLQAPSTPQGPTVQMLATLRGSPEVEWVFAVPGWPGPLDPAAHRGGAPFLGALDAVLVPELTAETAISLAGALALGTPIIAPKGADELIAAPYVPFKSADAQGLASVLEAQIARRDATAEGRPHAPDWETCAQAHQALFQDLANRSAGACGDGPARAADKAPFDRPVRLLLHGDEHKALGGPTVRVPRTAAALRALGVAAQAGVFDGRADGIDEDVVHLFNVWPPDSALHALHSLKEAGKTVIFSPIYLDLSERNFWQTELPRLADADPADLATRYAAYRTHAAIRGRLPEIVPGYNAMLREMLKLADRVIFLSGAERDALAAIGAQVDPGRASLVLNPVDVDIWSSGDPALFRETYLDGLPGPRDYVVCVGRIEERKNQLMLARAVRDLPVRLVFLGHPGSSGYAAQVRRAAGPDCLMVGRIAPGSEMLASALKGARAFALPSWAEGASLAALEAAACGTGLALSARSSERAYFGDLAQYCDPADTASIRAAIERAMEDGDDAARRNALQAHLRERNSWPQHAADTAAAYATAITAPTGAAAHSAPVHAMQHLFVDITPSGPARTAGRVVAGLAQALRERTTPARLIFWHPAQEIFVEVPTRFRDIDMALRYCRGAGPDDDPGAPVDLPPDSALVTLGDSWRHNDTYLNALEDLKMSADCSLLALVQNLAPLQAPYLCDAAEAAAFQAGLLRLAGLADGFFATSQSLADRVAQTLGDARLPATEVALLPPAASPPAEMQQMPDGPVTTRLSGRRFVLATGDVEPHSNHEMLCRIWADPGAMAAAGDLHLVIACPSGPASAALTDRIARDPKVKDSVHLVTDPEVADLSWLYDACLFTVFPTDRTDAALPVLESLAHGRLCLASSAVDLPDTTQHLVERIAPGDMTRWTDSIAAYGGAASRAASADARYAPLSFAQAAKTLAGVALAPREVRRFRRTYLGEVLTVGTAPLSIRFGPDWHPADTTVRWAREAAARLTFRDWQARRAGNGQLQVMLRLRAHIPEGRVLPFRITCGGLTVFEDLVGAASFPGEVLVSVPGRAADAQGVFDLHLHLPLSTVAVQDTGGNGPGARLIGIGLASAVLLDAELTNPLLYLSAPQHWSAGDITLTADMSDSAHREVIAPGLDFSPAWGVGAPNGRLDLRIPVLPGTGAHTLHLTVRPVASARHPVTATLRWNGRILGERTWHDDMPDTLTLPVTQADMNICGPSILSVQSGSVLTAADLGVGMSNRHAGLGVSDIVLIPEGAPVDE